MDSFTMEEFEAMMDQVDEDDLRAKIEEAKAMNENHEQPERIWIQHYDHPEWTWAAERINEDDFEYVRADLYETVKAQRDQHEEVLTRCGHGYYAFCEECDGNCMEEIEGAMERSEEERT